MQCSSAVGLAAGWRSAAKDGHLDVVNLEGSFCIYTTELQKKAIPKVDWLIVEKQRLMASIHVRESFAPVLAGLYCNMEFFRVILGWCTDELLSKGNIAECRWANLSFLEEKIVNIFKMNQER